jgi:DNA-binding response OmpR family regulator
MGATTICRASTHPVSAASAILCHKVVWRKTMRALIIEDDPDIGADVARGLESAGLIVDLITNGPDAWFAGDTEDYAIVVLDLGLPGLDGLTVLKRWRAAGRSFPVLILSARGDWTEKVEGIEAGADDYLAKPFQLAELVTRVRALLRRTAGHASAVVEVGRLRIDTGRMRIVADGREIQTSPLEFRLINYLAHRPDRPVSATELAEHLYGAADPADSNAIEALVMRLRRKIGADTIETRRGFGYRLAIGPE